MNYSPVKYNKKNVEFGITLIEITVVIVTILGLIAVTFIGASAYVNNAHRATCILQQDQLYKTILGHSRINDEPLKKDVEYYSESIANGLFPATMTCPRSGGGYTIFADDTLQDLIISCNDFNAEHRQ